MSRIREEFRDWGTVEVLTTINVNKSILFIYMSHMHANPKIFFREWGGWGLRGTFISPGVGSKTLFFGNFTLWTEKSFEFSRGSKSPWPPSDSCMKYIFFFNQTTSDLRFIWKCDNALCHESAVSRMPIHIVYLSKYQPQRKYFMEGFAKNTLCVLDVIKKNKSKAE